MSLECTVSLVYLFITGGANQNTIRIAQWLLQKPKATTYFGCVGADKMADEMRSKAEEVGVNVKYQVDPSHGTGMPSSYKTTVKM